MEVTHRSYFASQPTERVLLEWSPTFEIEKAKIRKYSFICNTFKNTIIKTTYQYHRWIYFKKQTGWKVRKLNFQKFNINSKYYNILYAVHKSKFGNSLINLISKYLSVNGRNYSCCYNRLLLQQIFKLIAFIYTAHIRKLKLYGTYIY